MAFISPRQLRALLAVFFAAYCESMMMCEFAIGGPADHTGSTSATKYNIGGSEVD